MLEPHKCYSDNNCIYRYFDTYGPSHPCTSDRVSLCNTLCCLGIHAADQAALELTPPASAVLGLKVRIAATTTWLPLHSLSHLKALESWAQW